MTIGEKIKAARLKKELSRELLGKACGYRGHYARAVVYRWETDKALPPVQCVRVIEKELGLSITEIIP